MLPPEFGGHALQLDSLLEHGVVAVPLDEVGAAHEGAMLRGAAVVVPQIEVEEVDGIRERRAGERAIGAQRGDEILRVLHAGVGGGDDLLGLDVDAVDGGRGVTLLADLLHGGLRADVVGAFGGDGRREKPGEAVGRIVRDLEPIDAGHVAGGTGGDEHIARSEGSRRRGEVEQIALRGEHDAVLRLIVDLHLRVVGAHVALAAGGGQAGQLDGAGVARVARGAGADGAVVVGLADGMALLAAADHGRSAFGDDEGMRRPLRSARLKLLRERNLLRREALFAVDGGPRGRGVAAAEEFLILGLVAGTAIAGGKVRRDHEAVMIELLLARRGLMAVEAVDALARVRGHFVLVHDGILEARMALGAFAGGADEVSRGLAGFNAGARAIDEKCGENEGEADDDSEKYGAERHAGTPPVGDPSGQFTFREEAPKGWFQHFRTGLIHGPATPGDSMSGLRPPQQADPSGGVQPCLPAPFINKKSMEDGKL
jgi:hypothetical protein